MAELRAIKSQELRELAKRFRDRATETSPGIYRDLMLRTAAELEERANLLDVGGGSETVLFDNGVDDGAS